MRGAHEPCVVVPVGMATGVKRIHSCHECNGRSSTSGDDRPRFETATDQLNDEYQIHVMRDAKSRIESLDTSRLGSGQSVQELFALEWILVA